jgi:formylglycine-generating enzyme required for sulfatase activity
MVNIPAGEFQMGADDMGPSEKPVHHVHVDPFTMDAKEVTVGQYAACVSAGACSAAKTGLPCNAGQKERTEHPINCVDFNRATAYCQWAGKRLPTEEEWEYAARGTDGRKYPWGNEPPANRACWDHAQGTCPVGSYPKGDSPFGVHDMIGNVAEWTSSFFSAGYSATPDKTKRVIRGGAFFVAETIDGKLDTSSARASGRWMGAPVRADFTLGIRCAR